MSSAVTSPDQIKQILERQIAERFQEAALDAAVEQATVELPAPVIQARAEETWRRVERQLAQQGMDPENYLQVQGRSRDEMIEQARPDAERALKRRRCSRPSPTPRNRDHRRRHARGAADPPGHEDHGHPEPADARDPEERARGLFKSDLRMRRALELIGEGAKPIPMEQAQAREDIWTPEKEREEKGALWTPGSDYARQIPSEVCCAG